MLMCNICLQHDFCSTTKDYCGKVARKIGGSRVCVGIGYIWSFISYLLKCFHFYRAQMMLWLDVVHLSIRAPLANTNSGKLTMTVHITSVMCPLTHTQWRKLKWGNPREQDCHGNRGSKHGCALPSGLFYLAELQLMESWRKRHFSI